MEDCVPELLYGSGTSSDGEDWEEDDERQRQPEPAPAPAPAELWTEAKSSELAAFNPLAGQASPPPTERPHSAGLSPRGGRRVDHRPRKHKGSRSRNGSRGRRRIEHARQLDAELGQGGERQLVTLPPETEEGRPDSEYTEEDLDEIESTQRHLQRGFESLVAECDAMLQADSGAAELEAVQEALSAVAHKAQMVMSEQSDGGAETGAASRAGGGGISSQRRQELEAELDRELAMEQEEAKAAAKKAKAERRKRAQRQQREAGGSRSGGGEASATQRAGSRGPGGGKGEKLVYSTRPAARNKS